MLEPVAAVILNTVLSGRSHLERSIPLHSVVKIVQSAPSRHLKSDFFNPQPRRVKGKARSTASLNEEFERSTLASRCREWSVQAKSPICASSSSRRNLAFFMRDTLSRQKPHKRGSPSISAHRTASHARLPRRSIQAILQKRHASRMAKDPPSDDEFVVTSSYSDKEERVHAPASGPLAKRFAIALQEKKGLLDPEEAWAYYVELEKADALAELPVHQLLTFADKILIFGDAHYDTAVVELSRLHEWGQRAKRLLSTLASRIAPLSLYGHWMKCGMSRAAALMGQIDESLGHIHDAQKIPIDYEEDFRILWAYKTLIYYIYRYHDASHVLTMLANEWLSMGSFLLKSSGQWHYGVAQYQGAAFRKNIYRLLAHIPRPAVVIASHFSQWGPELSKRIGQLLIDAYCYDKLPIHALEVLNQLKELKITIPLDNHLQLVRALVKEDTLGLAKDLFNTIPRGTNYKYYLQTALHLYAHCGDHRRAESYYKLLHEQGFINPFDTATLMHAYGVQGKSENVHIMFDDFFPIQEDGTRANDPLVQHFGVAIYSCARSGKIDDINYWLQEMVKAGSKPNIVIYNTIMQAFARSGDIASLRKTLDQLRRSDTKPTAITYVQLMTTLAHRKDISGVEALYKEAVEVQGIVPNRRMVNTLMNAHVMAGSWKGVIRVFDYIHSDAHPRIRLAIDGYTTLLKAYVLIGAPFRVVAKIFYKLEDLNVKPDLYTFALLIQSACDAGEMETASDIFHELDKLSVNRSEQYVDVYILTIIMAGYIRAGKHNQAKAVYEEMVARKIQPTAVTFNIMLNSYANERSAEALEISENFVKELMGLPQKPWDVPSYGKPSALELVYGPVLKGYSVMAMPEEVERINLEYLSAGGIETLGTLSAQFDAYRRTHQIDKVKELWPEIFRLGVEYVNEHPRFNATENDPTEKRLLNNVLCLPLSIYIDALSVAGEHDEIAHVWKEFQDHGFTFDAHNWNHITVALIRAAQLERAFQVVESVILPYQDQAYELIATREMHPTTPLTFTEKPDDEPDLLALGSQAQLRKPAASRLPLIRRNLRYAMSQIEEDEEVHADDLAYPIHVLHQISPAWNVWKVHGSVIRVLVDALENLRDGYLPKPVNLSEGLPQRDYSEDNEETRAQAKELLHRVYAQYPRTCQMLQNFQLRQTQREQQGRFRKR
ncbi:hypothetical protein BDP27DRAFT_1283937 [Rhodocollybia butyracea]|uniref:Pentatricopeptide repeat-containing protein n=1 Tax=Rhodocollybia butyracea TaxID=206335 RepID=A0A9P5Q291_9AGAR|nr:hypothetical protein BDP27DRAFT_1283937 [Rhodocollybia butyracea]